ncbi:MucR family transcriptional regulator (plasmid) [Komagataeibacter oboediens]|uniref:MucR family transcriptional regulator n=1 Tax=Komagataeibacter oboediens TaxID=65958 RepID=UPI0023DC83B8|nr:MucR family transcriptional regulator [Komagataeibacter oboediens]WEQ50922.1 MucR family transcriptional regulator [Komagataeibacter oboediens]
MTEFVDRLPNNAGRVRDLTVEIVTAYIKNNTVAADDLPTLIKSVYDALEKTYIATIDKTSRPVPAVPIRKSVFPDYLVCLEDGKKLKMLKRHLSAAYGMTVNHYRERWGLPRDYPMVAPNYASRRSVLAREAGLGRTITANHTIDDELVSSDVPITKIPMRRRGRKKNG